MTPIANASLLTHFFLSLCKLQWQLAPLNAGSWGQETTDLQGEEVGHSDSKIKVPIPALQFIRCLGRMPIVLKLCLNIVRSLKECNSQTPASNDSILNFINIERQMSKQT